ncbi:MAG: hypothetical protein JSS34_03145 [Proteobacteria bacterium]|nr:hypothetical protein [Pseudomonadota bacterium]
MSLPSYIGPTILPISVLQTTVPHAQKHFSTLRPGSQSRQLEQNALKSAGNAGQEFCAPAIFCAKEKLTIIAKRESEERYLFFNMAFFLKYLFFFYDLSKLYHEIILLYK